MPFVFAATREEVLPRFFSFEDRFTMRRRSVKDHQEKEEREREEKGVKKGEEEEKKIGKEG